MLTLKYPPQSIHTASPGPCFGDEGATLVCGDGRLAGIATPAFGEKCAPFVFVKADKYRRWIESEGLYHDGKDDYVDEDTAVTPDPDDDDDCAWGCGCGCDCGDCSSSGGGRVLTLAPVLLVAAASFILSF